MKTTSTSSDMLRKNIIRTVIGTVLLLAVPLVAMQVTDEVDWGLADFVIMSILLLGTGFAYAWIATKVGNIKYRIAIGVALLVVITLIWIELAVGIFD